MSRNDFSQDRIVFEDNHLMVVNKLPSEIVQGDKTGDQPLSEKIAEYIRIRDQKPGNAFCGVVHRLDRPVSGLVIFAKTSKGLSRMNEVFRDKEIRKSYLAVVEKAPPEKSGRLTHYLVKNEKLNKSFAYGTDVPGSLKAELEYTLLASSSHYHLLKITLITGRHHQIRCQLSTIGSPIKGDLKYGARRSNEGGFIHLHSYSLSFVHPIKKTEINLKALPISGDKLWQYFCNLISKEEIPEP
jgi:23S rRNA pseudouridine1911/1915/1917 synthase